MNQYVLDTSAAVAWYINEAFSLEARTWQERLLAGKATVLVPQLHYWEFGNVLRTLVVRQEIDEALAHEIYALHLDAPLEIRNPDPRLILDTALEYRATCYDAVYIALAIAHDVPLITAERTTREWVTRLGDRIIPIR